MDNMQLYFRAVYINNKIKYLRPDSKSQVTVEYDADDSPKRIHSMVSMRNLFFRRHRPVGNIAVDGTGTPFPYDEVRDARGYIPQISSTGLHHSLQACYQRYQHYLLDYFSEEGQEGYVQHNLFYDSDLDGVDESF